MFDTPANDGKFRIKTEPVKHAFFNSVYVRLKTKNHFRFKMEHD